MQKTSSLVRNISRVASITFDHVHYVSIVVVDKSLNQLICFSAFFDSFLMTADNLFVFSQLPLPFFCLFIYLFLIFSYFFFFSISCCLTLSISLSSLNFSRVTVVLCEIFSSTTCRSSRFS